MKANKLQELTKHCAAVAILAEKIFLHSSILKDNALVNDIISREDIAKMIFYAALFHDLGKTDPEMQNYLSGVSEKKVFENGVHIDNNKRFSFEDHPRHNEISYFLLRELDINPFKSKIKNKIFKHAVLWHHAEPTRKEPITSSKIIEHLRLNEKDLLNNLVEFEKGIFKIFPNKKDDICLNLENFKEAFEADSYDLGKYKYFYNNRVMNDNTDFSVIHSDIMFEAISSLIRTVIITADRIISSSGLKYTNSNAMYSSYLRTLKDSGLRTKINDMEKSFFPKSDRSIRQKKTVTALTNVNKKSGVVPILSAPAGSGKTKIALQFCARTNSKRVYIIAPRMIICEELYYEIKDKYLPSAKISVITSDLAKYYDGSIEYDYNKHENYDCDIIITTIDQIIKTITTHKSVDLLLDLASNHVIFDEYHEYVKMSGFDLLFAELVSLCSLRERSNILLMSATNNPVFLENMLNIQTTGFNSSVVKFESFNHETYSLELKEFKNDENKKNISNIIDMSNAGLLDDPLYQAVDDDKKTIFVSNTATKAQLAFLLNSYEENSLLAHSKFSSETKNLNLKKIKRFFGSIDKDDSCNILRAGPIVQASLNITSERLITEISSPENTLQRLGRLNRFGEKFTGEFIISVPTVVNMAFNELKNSEIFRYLSRRYEKESVYLWAKLLKANFGEKSEFKIKDFYDIYEEFYNDANVSSIVRKEILSSLKESYKNIARNIFNPSEAILANKKKVFKKRNNLRNDSVAVKMAIYAFNKNKKIVNTVFYEDDISISINDLFLNNNNKKLVYETIKSIKKLDPENKLPKNINENQYIGLAKSGSQSIYVSFTTNDLTTLEKEEQDEDSIIYIKTDDCDVGYIKLKKLS